MGARTKTFLELKKVTDHDCGNYRMGEIWGTPEGEIHQHVMKYGEEGFNDLCWHLVKCLSVAQQSIIERRIRESDSQGVSINASFAD